jgi:hypothetical protein
MQLQLGIFRFWKKKIKSSKLEKLGKEFRILEFKNLKIEKFQGVFSRARTGGVEFLCNHKNSGASTMAFAPSGISARVSGLKTSA